MPAVLEIILRGRDELSGPVGKAQVSLASVVKTGASMALGFASIEGAMTGVKNVMVNSIGAAAAFEGQMAQIRALTGATKGDTDLLEKSILKMTKTLPKSPAELGAGAYFVLSSGITDATDAAKVLEIAAKASTIGLGETEVVADALTTVLNAYQMEAGQAGRVTDILIQAVKDGKAEASAFSGVLGRVVPIAAQMGISFEEVAANLATFTRLGVSAEEAATGLRGVMSQLLSPGEEAKNMLAEFGLSAQGLRAEIREKGLLAVLQELLQRFEGNEEAIAKLFPDIRGLTNVLATAGVQNETYVEILGNMDKATGNLDRGFAEVSQTTRFKMQKAMNDLNGALMELGTEALPLVASAATSASDAIAILAAVMHAAKGDTSDFNLDLAKSAENLLDFAGSLPTPARDIKLLKDAVLDFTRGDIQGGVINVGRSFTTFGDEAVGVGKKIAGIFGGGDKGVAAALREADEEIARFKERAGEMAAQVAAAKEEEEALGGVKGTLEDVVKGADDARSALTRMFSEPTAEELAAEAALADYRLELAQLEGKSDDATAAEAARATDLRDNLIPAQQHNLDLIRLQKESVEAHARAQDGAAPSLAAWRQNIEGQAGAVTSLNDQIREFLRLSTLEANAAEESGLTTFPIPGRQQGGPVEVGRAFLVGERGPELFVPDVGGSVVPMPRVAAAVGGGPAAGGGVRNVTVNLIVNSKYPPNRAQLREEMRDWLPELRRALSTGGG